MLIGSTPDPVTAFPKTQIKVSTVFKSFMRFYYLKIIDNQPP